MNKRAGVFMLAALVAVALLAACDVPGSSSPNELAPDKDIPALTTEVNVGLEIVDELEKLY